MNYLTTILKIYCIFIYEYFFLEDTHEGVFYQPISQGVISTF